MQNILLCGFVVENEGEKKSFHLMDFKLEFTSIFLHHY